MMKIVFVKAWMIIDDDEVKNPTFSTVKNIK